jgi:hypothetical protein
MYGDWNPQAYLQAQSNADLERQYRESEYGRQQELTKQAGLESAFQEQNNPLRLEQGRLTNQNLGYTGKGLQEDNRVKSVNADIAEQTKQYKLNDAQRKDLLAASENDIAMGEAQARKLMMSLDPNERKQGEQLYEFTKYARDEKTKHAQAVELRKMQEDAANKRQAGTNATSIKVAEIGAASRTAAAGAKNAAVPFIASLRKMKVKEQVTELSRVLATGIDPDTGEPMSPMAKLGYETQYQQAVKILDEAPAPGAGVDLEIGPDGKPKLANKPARGSVDVLNNPQRGNLSNLPQRKPLSQY